MVTLTKDHHIFAQPESHDDYNINAQWDTHF
jgi:hypothetical protein